MAASILIVDGDRLAGTELQAALAALGYDAYALAVSADDALARARERRPDLAVVDLAGGGIATAELLRAQLGVAIVYLAAPAGADAATLARAVRSDPHGYLGKPIRAADLHATIELALHRHALEGRRDHAIAMRLEPTDRLASLGALAPGLAHEVNNPLSVVVANASYVADELARVREEHGDEVAIDEAIAAQGELLGAADRIARLIADLREIAKPAQDGEARTEVAVAIARAVRTTGAALRERARVVVEIAAGLPTVAGDESRLVQVLVHLLRNAGQAMTAPGTIRLRAAHAADGRVELEVSDPGAGMSAEMCTRAFAPFVTTRPGAAGLGLAVCRGIVTSLGGEITATSAAGQGTTVRVRLAPADAPVAIAVPPRAGRARVLVIDDEETVLRALGRMLRDHEVVTARGASEALDRIAGDRAFDVIFTDVSMPDMTGIELFEHLRATRPADARRLVFLTGGAITDDTREFLAAVPNVHVEKPVRVATLDEVIARVIATTSASPA